MKVCKDCNGTKIKSATNYTHGTKSGSTTSLKCANCGSYAIKVTVDKQNYRQKRR